MIDKTIDDKNANDLKRNHNHYLDKGPDFLKNTQIKVDDVFGDTLDKDSTSPDQINKLSIFLTKIK